jgi:NitT/TauT family transport system permease protein
LTLGSRALPVRAALRGATSIVILLLLWELGARSKHWMAGDLFAPLRFVLGAFGFKTTYLPCVGATPPPSGVLRSWLGVLGDGGYWQSWAKSFLRVSGGFAAAMVVGIPFGLLLAVNRVVNGLAFPLFEVLRPIPPLAWVPASIIFWPTQELSIAFVTFLGAFYTIVINVVGGARSIDARYLQAARSMGSSRWDLFRRVILPGTLPSIVVGAVVGMGITWEVVVAAEMISGGGSQIGGTAGGGLGFFIWSSYVGGSYEQIVVGMASIGVAGFLSSELLRVLGRRLTPWLTRR